MASQVFLKMHLQMLVGLLYVAKRERLRSYPGAMLIPIGLTPVPCELRCLNLRETRCLLTPKAMV